MWCCDDVRVMALRWWAAGHGKRASGNGASRKEGVVLAVAVVRVISCKLRPVPRTVRCSIALFALFMVWECGRGAGVLVYCSCCVVRPHRAVLIGSRWQLRRLRLRCGHVH